MGPWVGATLAKSRAAAREARLALRGKRRRSAAARAAGRHRPLFARAPVRPCQRRLGPECGPGGGKRLQRPLVPGRRHRSRRGGARDPAPLRGRSEGKSRGGGGSRRWWGAAAGEAESLETRAPPRRRPGPEGAALRCPAGAAASATGRGAAGGGSASGDSPGGREGAGRRAAALPLRRAGSGTGTARGQALAPRVSLWRLTAALAGEEEGAPGAPRG